MYSVAMNKHKPYPINAIFQITQSTLQRKIVVQLNIVKSKKKYM